MTKHSLSMFLVTCLTAGSVMCTDKGGDDEDDSGVIEYDSGISGECYSNSDCGAGQTCLDGTCVTDGALRFTLQWDEYTDLDLYVTTPGGTTISYQNNSGDGGYLDVDDTSGGQGSVENIYFNDGLSSGQYVYWVNNFDGGSASWRLSVHVDGREVDSVSGSFSSSDSDSEYYTFTY